MLYLVDERDIRISNNDIDAIEEFRACSDKELKYIFLTYDYETPLRRMPAEARKKEALRRAGYKTSIKTEKWEKDALDILNNKNQQVVDAIKAFRRLNYNLDRETLLSYDLQLIEFQKKAGEPKNSDADWKLAISINRALPVLLKQRREIIELLDLNEDEFIEDEENHAKKVELSTNDLVNSEIINYQTGKK